MIPWITKNQLWLELVSKLPPLDQQNGPWIAGGSVRKLYQGYDWRSGDIDVFFQSAQQLDQWHQQFKTMFSTDRLYHFSCDLIDCPNLFNFRSPPVRKKSEFGAYVHHTSDNAVTYKIWGFGDQDIKLQIINARYCKDIEDIWSKFDINICEFASVGQQCWRSESVDESLNTKQLTMRPEFSKAAPMRILKYLMYGYNFDTPTMEYLAENLYNNTLGDQEDY